MSIKNEHHNKVDGGNHSRRERGVKAVLSVVALAIFTPTIMYVLIRFRILER